MATTEQLQAWREEFYKAFPARPLSASHQAVTDNDYVFVGYLRAKQETEQALIPITADDVTDETVAVVLEQEQAESFSDYKRIIAATYNAVIKHRSEAK